MLFDLMMAYPRVVRGGWEGSGLYVGNAPSNDLNIALYGQDGNGQGGRLCEFTDRAAARQMLPGSVDRSPRTEEA